MQRISVVDKLLSRATHHGQQDHQALCGSSRWKRNGWRVLHMQQLPACMAVLALCQRPHGPHNRQPLCFKGSREWCLVVFGGLVWGPVHSKTKQRSRPHVATRHAAAPRSSEQQAAAAALLRHPLARYGVGFGGVPGVRRAQLGGALVELVRELLGGAVQEAAHGRLLARLGRGVAGGLLARAQHHAGALAEGDPADRVGRGAGAQVFEVAHFQRVLARQLRGRARR